MIKATSILFISCAIAVSGCAQKSSKIAGAYTSPILYQSYSCRQLGEEGARISARASQVSGVQDKNAQKDAVATGIAIILFWPAAFFVGGSGGNRAELARLKGELEAIEKVSIQKNCSIEFRS